MNKPQTFIVVIACLTLCYIGYNKFMTNTKWTLEDDMAIEELITIIYSPFTDIRPNDYELKESYAQVKLNKPRTTFPRFSELKNSLYLGAYAMDLELTLINGHNQQSLQYIKAIQELLEVLMISYRFDAKILTREESDQLRSITTFFVETHEKIDFVLQEENRNKARVLWLTGAWLEYLYIICQAYEHDRNNDLRFALETEYMTLGRFSFLLKQYQNEPIVSELIKDLEKLDQVYTDVMKETEFKEPEMIEKDGELVFLDNVGGCGIKMEDKHIIQINHIAQKLRAKYIEPH